MKTFSEILSLYSSPGELASDLGVEYQAARKMIDRASVHPRHWVKLIAGLKARSSEVEMNDLQRLRPDLYPHLVETTA
jgi:hypothetical protein